MNRATILTMVAIILLLLAGWLFFWRTPAEAPEILPEEEIEDSGMLITAKHEYIGGTHVIAGEVSLPTPCHILSVDSEVSADGGEALIIFESTTSADMCAQVITPARFKVEFEAMENARMSALWNGQSAELNLIPVAPGETLDEFEIFIKG